MKNILSIIAFLLISLQVFAQGEIIGTVTDEQNQKFGGVIIKVMQGGILKGGTISDDDGSYSVKPLKAGLYDMEFSSSAYVTKKIKGVKVISKQAVRQDVKMQVSASNELQSVVIKGKPPVVNKVRVTSSEQMERAPTRNIVDMASLGPNVKQSRSGGALRIGGARHDGTVYMVDGQAVQGSNTNYSSGNQSQPEKRRRPSDGESYSTVRENDFMNVKASPLSTMSVDVDHASYATIRSFINGGSAPPADAVRVEEMVNYFSYKYPQPKDDKPIAMTTELTECPWNEDNLLLKIGMQAKVVATDNLPSANIVFLIDVSGSMNEPDKLPLLKSAFRLLTDQLREKDKVSIVVYAGNSGLVLPATSGDNKKAINEVLERLSAGGSTAGGAGIELAYKVAAENFIKGGNNRVVLATDGDFNVGISSESDLEKLIVSKREKGIFLSCLGFGSGNYQDSKMEILADKGNGNYNYIDNIDEAKKTLVKEFGGTLFTVAKDVKTQIEFNPDRVKGYRLIGYENRLLNAEDFKDDKKDAGEMGAGHSVTILYELIPSRKFSKDSRSVSKLKYQNVEINTTPEYSDELATIKFRYKEPDGNKSKELEHVITANIEDLTMVSSDTRFSASVALFGMILSDSKYKKSGSFKTVLDLAENAESIDKEGYRKEFIALVKKAEQLKKN